jgi:hypothetical protein
MASSTSRARPAGYLERLRTPWWWYLGAVGVSVLLGAEFGVAVSGWLAWVPFALLLPGSLLVVRRLSSGVVAVEGATLRAGDRRLDLADLEEAIGLTSTELRRLVGRHSDPLAFAFIRSWIGPGVQLVLRPGTRTRTEQPAPSARRSKLARRSRPARRTEPAGHPESVEQFPPAEPERLPEPYWVLSSRHPDELLAALRAAAPAARPPG